MQVYRYMGGRHSGGGEGIAEAPRSVKIIDLCIIYGRFLSKCQGLK